MESLNQLNYFGFLLVASVVKDGGSTISHPLHREVHIFVSKNALNRL